MKYLFRILSLSIIVSATIFFTACDDGGEKKKSEKQTQIDLMVGTWNTQSVTHNSVSVTTDFSSFKLTLAQAGTAETMTYTTAGRPTSIPSPWDASGTVTFGTPVTSQIVLGDGSVAQYSATGNSLTITFSAYSGDGYTGRVSSAAGDWVFTLTK